VTEHGNEQQKSGEDEMKTRNTWKTTLMATAAAATLAGFTTIAAAQTGSSPSSGGSTGGAATSGASGSGTVEQKGGMGGAMKYQGGSQGEKSSTKPGQSAQEGTKEGTKAGTAETSLPQKGAEKSTQQKGAETERNERGAQTESGKSGVSSTQENASVHGGKSGGKSVQLSQDQRTRIKTAIGKGSSARLSSKPDFDVSVGTKIPRDVHITVLPRDVVQVVPQYEGYDYVVVEDQILIIDPDTLEIVAVIEA
jgi:hypothetical protein